MKEPFKLYRHFQIVLYVIAFFVIIINIVILAGKVWGTLEELKAAENDNMGWVLSQLEVDYLNLRVAQEIVVSDNDASLSDLRNKFDVFYSRASVIRDGRGFEAFKQSAETQRLTKVIWEFLQYATPLIDGDDQSLRQSLNALISQTKDLNVNIRSLSLLGIDLYALTSDQRRSNLSQTLIIIAGLTFLLLAALTALSWGFLRQYKLVKQHSHDTLLASSRLNAVVASSLDAVIVIDRDARILEFNHAAEQTFGYSKEEAIGGDLAEMIVPEQYRQAHRDGMQRYLNTGEKRVVGKGRLRLEAKRKSEEVFPIELSISSAKSNEGEVFVAFLRDISNRVIEEEELKQARDDALLGEKAKAELLAVMSHEMRTPLNGMLGTLELMQDTHLSERQAQYLEIANTSGELLLHHVNDVLDISRLDSGKFETDLSQFDISKLVNEICDSQRSNAASKGNRITTNLSSLTDQIVIGDDLRIRQILLNIIGNSIKFTRDGNIGIEAERKAKDIIEFRISDDGIGMQEADLERIFEDFVTLDSSYAREQAGTGLGLGITKRMIEAMNGSIGVESIKDKGSLFWFRLSLPAQTLDDATDNIVEDQDLQPITPHRVLVVEDNEINRFVVREMLESDGHTVVEVTDGDEGVAICQKEKFDAILMDISMPRLDGVEATKLIRENNGPSAKTPIIALTAHAMPEEIIKFNEAGMNDTLIKPISRVLLRKAIKLASDRTGESQDQQFNSKGMTSIDITILNEMKEALGEYKAQQLLQKFIHEAETELGWIKSNSASVENNPEFLERVHKLAGSASLFGAVKLHSLLFDIETLYKSGSFNQISEHTVQLAQVWRDTKSALIK